MSEMEAHTGGLLRRDHPSPDRLALPEEQRDPELRDHLAGCPRCRVQVRLMAAAREDDEPPGWSEASRALTACRTELSARFDRSVQSASGTFGGANAGEAADGFALPRWVDVGPIGAGGMGEVRRVLDPALGRTMALKVIHARGAQDPGAVARFVAEARVTAQLQHPGVVPVHALSRLPDGRPCFTMQEVRGRTFARLIADLHESSGDGAWGTTASGWTLRRLVEAFRQVCLTVAWAHARGVVHRDLKPGNLMAGDYGEVLVLDWGLAKVGDRPDPDGTASELAPPTTEVSGGRGPATEAGTISGTPAYMSPEQARGEIDRLGPHSDVFSLGAVLYRLLTGLVPYPGPGALQMLAQAVLGPPEPPGSRDDGLGLPIPAGLEAICVRALRHDPADRFRDARQVADELAAWLDGVRAREQALLKVDRADEAPRREAELRRRSAELMARATAALEGVPEHAPVADKEPAWALQEQGRELAREAELAVVEYEQLLRAALDDAPGLPEALDRLADHHQRLHAAAEAARDGLEAARQEALLRGCDRGRHAGWLKGEGAVSLRTDPPGATVRVLRYREAARRLVAEPVGVETTTPIDALTLPRGSYLLEVDAPDGRVVRWPARIDRLGHWSPVPPDGDGPDVLRLPRPDELGPDDVLVPQGWFRAGGDPGAADCFGARELWCDAFVMTRFPVTNREYIDFLDDLVRSGREAEALRHAPRDRSGGVDDLGTVVYGRRADGGFELVPDADGDLWLPDWPVLLVDYAGASAFARWRAQRDGLGWRLPGELEWEKAARGVDGRYFPWGDRLDPAFCCMRSSHAGHPSPVVVDSCPVDESPYGVRGLAGNVRDWCCDHLPGDGPPAGSRVVVRATPPGAVESGELAGHRGGSWWTYALFVRSAQRRSATVHGRFIGLGFRLVRPWAGSGGTT